MARPKTLPSGTARVEFKLPADFDAALGALATASGEAKSSHLRRAVAWYLAEYGLGQSAASTPVITNPTHRRRNHDPQHLGHTHQPRERPARCPVRTKSTENRLRQQAKDAG